MTDTTALATSVGSPFDAIRQVRPDGTEFWSARDLMPMLGYDEWRNFTRCVTEARRAAEITGASDQFVDSNKMVATGSGAQRAVVDVHLTRYAAYMVAMSCDGRKPEVAEAKTYFAIRTRQAEVAPQKELTEDEIVQQALAITVRKVEALTAKVTELEPAAKSWNHLASASGHYSVAEAAKILSQDPGISIGRDRLFAYMSDIKWVFRSRNPRGGWEAYQTQVDAGRLYERPAKPFLNEKTGDFELPAPTVRVTAKGVARLRELLTTEEAA